mmetsp:Transcript_52706/g.132502  ORF Transcript_52706/g.132502 Transcript_52706/m.132502 type:complete len:99 (+) Transcript_52706:1436-1732(+)
MPLDSLRFLAKMIFALFHKGPGFAYTSLAHTCIPSGIAFGNLSAQLKSRGIWNRGAEAAEAQELPPAGCDALWPLFISLTTYYRPQVPSWPMVAVNSR